MKRTVLILFITLFSYQIVLALNKIIFNKITVNQGLSHSDVNAIVQDKDGFIWLGTYNGLCRYDGKNIVTFKTENSGLSNNRILSLHVGQDSILYIGTEVGGLNFYNPNTGKIKPIKNASPRLSLSNNEAINAIFSDRAGNIYICSDIGISLVKKNKDIFLKSYLIKDRKENIISACELDGNRLLLGTNRGLLIFNKKDQTYTSVLRDKFNQYVNVIRKKADHDFLIGSSEGLYEYQAHKRVINKVASVAPLSILIDKQKNIWIGSANDGLHLFDFNMKFRRAFKSDISTPNSISGNVIRSLYDDASGVLWIGTISDGVSTTNITDKKIELYTIENWKKDALVQSNIITFFEDRRNILWIGTRTDGLSIMNLKNRQIKHVEVENKSNLKDVSAFYQDHLGALWIGTWQGLYRVSRNQTDNIWSISELKLESISTELSHSNVSIFKIIKDRDNHLWLSTSNGVYQYIPEVGNYYAGKFINYKHDPLNENSIQDNFVTDLLYDTKSKNKTIWVGTRRGVSRIIVKEEKVLIEGIALSVSKKSAGEFVSVIHQDKKNQIWIATLGGGLHKMISALSERKPRFISYKAETHAFPTNELESLLEDEHGMFWIGGNGIMKFNPENGKIKHYRNKDRLQSNSFKIWSAVSLTSGEMVFGGVNGFNIFHPDSLADNLIVPKVLLTGLKVFSQELQVGDKINDDIILNRSIFRTDEITLSYASNSLTFEFAALHFTSPQDNLYKYKLIGFDDDWHYAKGFQNFGVYTNLKHGRYKFLVYGSNSDGIWSSKPAVLEVEIKPPFWKTSWAYLFYVALVSFLLYLFRLSSLKKLANQHILEMEKKMRESEQMSFDNKIKFFTDVSHEIKTPLSLISVPVEELLSTAHIGSSTRRKLNMVNRNISRLMSLVEQILDFRKYESNMMKLEITEVNIKNFINELIILFQPLADSKQVHIEVDFEIGQEFYFFDAGKIEKVVLNLLSNALKFSPNQSKLEIACHDDQYFLYVSVNDNGIGIHENELNMIFEPFYQAENNNISGGTGIGLSLSKYIIDQHHGEISVSSSIDDGTTFSIKIPKGQDYFQGSEMIHAKGFKDKLEGTKSLSVEDARNEGTVEDFYHEYNKEATIIIVEDNDDFRNYMAQLLSPRYHTILIGNSACAYEIIVTEQPDLVITDVLMPEMTGLELCSKIKNDTTTAHIPVMMLTARNLLSHEIDGYETGADAYVPKPFNLKLFKARVDTLIKTSRRIKGFLSNSIDIEPSKVSVSTYDQNMLKKCLAIIEEHMHKPSFGVETLCKEMGMSRPQLYRKIKLLTGLSAVQFIRTIRLKRAAQILANDNTSVSDIMYKIGINNSSYFSKIFKEEFGILPKQFSNKNKS